MKGKALVTFLGKSQVDPKTGYRKVRYRFPDGREAETADFGRALAEHLDSDRLVILGTAGSMWSVLVESLADADEAQDLRLELMEAEAAGSVDQALLDRAQPLMARATGREVRARLTGYAQTSAEQMELLHRIREAVVGATVAIDVTHGFRHFGMLGLQAGFLLQGADGLRVEGVWYGALDMPRAAGQPAPVLRLDGLLAMQAWVAALQRYDESGNYAVFADLLEREGVPADKVRCLRDGAYFESVLNVGKAQEKLRTFLQVLDAPLPGTGVLFQAQLRERLAWVRGGGIAERQFDLARRALKGRDYLRAAVHALEATITRHCMQSSRNPLDYTARREADQEFEKELSDLRHGREVREAYRRLKPLRNAMAHAIPPERPELERLLADPERLHQELARCLHELSA